MNRPRQLVSKLLHEEDQSFTTTVKKVVIYGLADDQDTDDARAMVTWDLDMEYRDYGLKGIDVTVQSVKVDFSVTNHTTERTVTQSISSEGWKVETVTDRPMNLPFSLYPVSLEVYVREKRMTVSF